MGLFDNPNLELQALLVQLQKQEQNAQRLIAELQLEEKKLQQQIITVAKDIQTWNARIQKAKAAKRMDLANAALEKETALRREGERLWQQMEAIKKRLVKAKELLVQIKQKSQEVRAKAANVGSSKTTSNFHYTNTNTRVDSSQSTTGVDDVERDFQRWEIETELEEMKRNLGL